MIAFSGPASAAYPPGELELSLQIEHNETRWQYSGETLTSKSAILGVQLQETLAPRLRGRLHAGYLDLSQPDNTLAAARVTTGYYAGIELALLVLDTSRLKLELSSGYRYQYTEGHTDSTDVSLVWHDTYAQLGVTLPLSERLDLHAIGGASRTSGEQRVGGDTDQLLTFDEKEQRYYAAGLSYRVDETGYLSVSWLGGNRDGFRLGFHRGF
ncbi:hypothetical protein [Thiohalophilus sp.]|uniref:hypothetical protein n=1 Tax=Thiohalophilus sp. TaxID=3028392 RepID=UPI002ACE33E1|nr:hypothetical protein [Thiohalophilus sp.]MDZ7662202.1 hypothetical protein [Thiohalophilus sp.]